MAQSLIFIEHDNKDDDDDADDNDDVHLIIEIDENYYSDSIMQPLFITPSIIVSIFGMLFTASLCMCKCTSSNSNSKYNLNKKKKRKKKKYRYKKLQKYQICVYITLFIFMSIIYAMVDMGERLGNKQIQTSLIPLSYAFDSLVIYAHTD